MQSDYIAAPLLTQMPKELLNFCCHSLLSAIGNSVQLEVCDVP